MHKSRHWKSIFLLSFFLLASLGIGITSSLINDPSTRTNTNAEAASSACKCDDDDICYPDGCTRKPKTEDNTFDEGRYDRVCDQNKPGWPPSAEYQRFYCAEHQPDCCADMVAYQDSRLCCFMERWHCHPNYCKQLTGDKGDCGKYWGLPGDWKEYGCVKEDSNGDKVPKYGLAPNIPGGNSQPTAIPTQPVNTQSPTQPANQPTQPPNNQQPTNPPRQDNVTAPSPTPQRDDSVIGRMFPTATPLPQNFDRTEENPSMYNPGSITQNNDSNPAQQNTQNSQPDQTDNSSAGPSLPKIEFKSPQTIVKETVSYENISKIQTTTEKPLEAVKTTFITVKTMDQQLEITVENWIEKVKKQLQNFIS